MLKKGAIDLEKVLSIIKGASSSIFSVGKYWHLDLYTQQWQIAPSLSRVGKVVCYSNTGKGNFKL